MKTCKRCNVTKNESEFGNNKAKRDGLQTYCKECSANYASGYYKAGDRAKKHSADVQERKKEKVARNKQLVYEYLLTHGCVDCPEKDPVVLEFDHQRDKKMNVSRLVLSGYPEKTILDEIAKCEVRCASCHRRKTAKDQGWYKDK